MSDLINRQAAIDAFNVYVIIGRGNGKTIASEAINNYANTVIKRITALPPAQPEIIRCMDCKYYTFKPGPNSVNCYVKHCTRSARASTSPDDYCSRGERRTDGVDS